MVRIQRGYCFVLLFFLLLQSHRFNVFRGTDVTQARRSSFVETTKTKIKLTVEEIIQK